MKVGTYLDIGTHKAIAMRPDDDLKLGKLVKKNEFKQEAALGYKLLVIEWYKSVRQAIQGFEKNIFAGADYHISTILFVSMILFFTSVFPFIAIGFAKGLTQLLLGINILFIFLIYAFHAKYIKMPFHFSLGYAAFHPIGASLLIYIILRSTCLNLVRGKIIWRGTEYPLSALRKNEV